MKWLWPTIMLLVGMSTTALSWSIPRNTESNTFFVGKHEFMLNRALPSLKRNGKVGIYTEWNKVKSAVVLLAEGDGSECDAWIIEDVGKRNENAIRLDFEFYNKCEIQFRGPDILEFFWGGSG